MPSKVVDLSARSKIIRDEPFYVHFWECTPEEFLAYLRNPRTFLSAIGINIPEDCRIETTIENHDWIGTQMDLAALTVLSFAIRVGGTLQDRFTESLATDTITPQ